MLSITSSVGVRGGFFRPDFFELVAVDNLDLRLQRHETLGLVGESGSGKTTFGQALIRLVTHGTGEVYFDGVPLSALIVKVSTFFRCSAARTTDLSLFI